MRIRSTKPEFWRSKTIAQLDWATRLVLKGLESYVDDNGVGKDDLALIAADVFPRDLSANPRDTLASLSEAISVIESMGLIARYEVDGEDLLYIDRWKDLQRIDKPGKGRFPRPDGTTEYAQDVNRDSYRSPRETVASPPEVVAPVTGEQGNRGAEEEQTCAAPPRAHDHPRFQDFWDVYPRRLDRRKASKAFTNAVKRADPDVIIAGAHRYATDPNRDDAYTKYAEGWLNGDRWLDEPLPSRTSNVYRIPASDAAFAQVQALKGQPSRMELEQ